jgi:hypothetical protein
VYWIDRRLFRHTSSKLIVHISSVFIVVHLAWIMTRLVIGEATGLKNIRIPFAM